MQKVIQNVLGKMREVLDGMQLELLQSVLEKELAVKKGSDLRRNEELLGDFLASKAYEDCARGTLELYESENRKFIQWLGKSVVDVNKKDIERYLAEYREMRHVSNITLNNMRRYISAFFTYLEYEDIIPCNPVRKTKPVKESKVIKKPFTELEVEELRENVGTLRDRAITCHPDYKVSLYGTQK